MAPAASDGFVDVQIRPAFGGDGEATVRISSEGTLQDVKDALALQLRRPEIATTPSVDFVKFMPNGEAVGMSPKSQIGTRRTLNIRGCELRVAYTPQVVREVVVTLKDFDQLDPDASINSPRSLRACQMEGVLPEEIVYTPEECFEQAGLPQRIASMRYEFFEAYRQDCLAMARRARETLIAEEGQGQGGLQGTLVSTGGNWGGSLAQADYHAVKSFFEAMTAHCTCPRGGKLFENSLRLSGEFGDAAAHRPDKWAPPSPKAFRKITAGNDTMRLTGSAFYGAGKPEPIGAAGKVPEEIRDRQKELVQVVKRKDQLFEEAAKEAKAIKDQKSAEAAKMKTREEELRAEIAAAEKLAQASKKAAPRTDEVKVKQKQLAEVVLSIDRKLEEAATAAKAVKDQKHDEASKLKTREQELRAEIASITAQFELNNLRRLPYGRNKGEQLAGALDRTESVVVVQRQDNAKRMKREHKLTKKMANRMVALAEAQKDAMELRALEETEKRKMIDDNHVKNRGDWSKGVQKTNYNNAAKRGEIWAARREVIAQNALASEAERNATFLRTTWKELGVMKDNANLRDMQRSCFARRFLDRRNRWARSYKEVRHTVRVWETSLGTRRAQSLARVEDQKLRVMTWTEVQRELKALRKDFQDMVREREERRRDFRRGTISDQLLHLAGEADREAAREALRAAEAAEASFTMGLTASTSSSTLRPRPHALASMSSSASMGSLGQLTSSPFRLPTKAPRFDFPRVANDLLSPLALTYSLTEMSQTATS